MSINFTRYEKDPNEILDYKFDLANKANGGTLDNYLAVGETILSFTTIIETGLTEDSSGITDSNTSITIWLSGGVALEDYVVEANIVTSAGRTVSRSIIIECRDR